MPFCEMVLEGSPVISSPLNRMRPEVGLSTPVKQLKKVLLPAPFGPMMAHTLSRLTSKLTWESAARPPNRTVNSSVLRTGAGGAPRPFPGERPSLTTSTLTLRSELAGRGNDGLVLWNHVEHLELTAFDGVEELVEEGLVIGLAQRLVPLREVIAELHLEPLQRLDQLHRVLARLELRHLHAELERVHGLVVRLHVAVGQRAGRIDPGQSLLGLVEEA